MAWEAFGLSTAAVAVGEIGDKTQLLALMLAARLRRPLPIVIGIVVATLFNHAMAGAVGAWVTTMVGPQTLRWILGLSFGAMAIWMLIPDKLDDDDVQVNTRLGSASALGAFMVTSAAFFLAEMGDKTQIATVALAARFQDLTSVVSGTTLGMLIADVPAVFVGNGLSERLPTRLLHGIAAALFALIGCVTLLGGLGLW